VSEIRTALVIDDDPDISELLRAILETHGYDVETMSDGIHAIDLDRNFDVILLDLRMPVFDGERLTDYWRLTTPQILKRVILLSGYSQSMKGRALGTFATVGKPFQLDDLMRVVTDCVAKDRDSRLETGHAT
jgi:CheY-like chemotaxis protein